MTHQDTQDIFLTGAGGCVGQAVLNELLDRGHRVTVLLHPNEADAFTPPQRVDRVVADLLDVTPDMLPPRSTVIHLAAKVHAVPKTPAEHEAFFRVNRDGTTHLAQCAVKAHCAGFVFISTLSVYGPPGPSGCLGLQTPTTPTTSYGKSKLAAEKALPDVLGDTVPHVILRPCVIYGPGDRGNFGALVRAVRKGRIVTVDGGRARKSTLYVRNLAKIISTLAEHLDRCDGMILNVADTPPQSVAAMIDGIAGALGKQPHRINLPATLLKPFALLGDLGGWVLRRELPLSSRKLRVLTTDTIVDTSELQRVLPEDLDILSFQQSLRQYLAKDADA